jgi:RHS repeat-associated protein
MTPPGGNLLVLAPVTSNANGQITFTYVTGCSDAIGTYQLIAFDPTKNKQSNTITQTITASSGCASTGAPTLNSNPTSGDQLTGYFPLTGGGYTPYGTVQLTINPAVNNSTMLGQTTANANGLIYFVWTTDCSIPAATYSVTARDLTKTQSSPPLSLTLTSNTSCSTPGPKITQLSPNPMPGSTQPQYLTIFGSSFQVGAGLKVRLQKQGQPYTDYLQLDMVWSNQIRVQITVDNSAANWTVQVINPDNTSSAATALSVLAGVTPVATSLTNKPAVTKGAKFNTKGTGLTPNGSVQVLLRLPDGRIQQVIANAIADATGSYTHNFDTNQLSTFGSHQLIYKDVTTGQQSNEIPFTCNPVQNGAATNQNHDNHNDPIDTSTGNYTYDHTDLVIAGRGLPFRFARHYESQNSVASPIGNGWTHNYYATLSTNPVDNSVTIRLGDGYTVIFDLQGTAYKPRYENVYETLASPSAGVFVLATKQQVKYTFNMGKMTSISDRNGNTIQLSYTGTNVTAITDTVGRTITLAYDASNRLVTVTDPIGRTLQYAYDSSSNLISFTDARSKSFTFTYDGASRMLTGLDPENHTFVTNAYNSLGRVSSQADGQGNTWSYSYDSITGTAAITDPNQKTSLHVHDSALKLILEQDSYGKQTSFGYNPNNNRDSVTDRNVHTTRMEFDPMGNVTKVTDALNQISYATYNSFNDPLSRTDPLGNTTTYTYDAKGNLTSGRDPLGNTTSYTYNSFGQVISTTDAESRTTAYTYDASGNLIREQDALGNNTQYTYDAVGRRLSMIDSLSFTTTYAYDNNDNLIRVTDPINGVISYTYDGNNNRLTVRDQRQNTTTYTYDGNYKLTTTTDALGGKVTTTYDKLRNPTTITDQRGGVTRTTYDPESRLIQSVDPVGNSTTYGYDPAGNRVTITDPLGKTTTYAYDALNRATSVTDALGAVTKTSYDPLSRVLTSTDAANNVTSSTYDAAGRMTKGTDAANGTVMYAYDRVGNRTSVTDPRGKTTTFTYDALNRLKTITDPVGNVTTNTYDAVGNLTRVVDGNGSNRTYAYDGNRRLTGITYSIGSAVSYTYDANGNRTRMTDGVGTSTFAYDALNRMSSYGHPLGTQMQFTYDAASNRTTMQYAPGKAVLYSFDAANRLASVRDWSNSTTSYGYDAASRVSAVTFPNGVAAAYSYDAVGRTTNIQYNKSATTLYSEGTTWSANGNPLSSNISGLVGSSIPSESTPYTYDDASRLAIVASSAVSNDKNNNITLMPGAGSATAFNYDLNNRATSISGPSASAQMKYFGDGKLAELVKASGTARYLQDPSATGNRILAELDASGNIQRAYIYGMGMVSVLDGPSTYYYLHNLQGSTVAMADGSGTLRATYRYDPFGRVIQASGGLTYPFTFLGRYSVSTVGDYSITTFRLYDSRNGRFTGLDPIHWQGNSSVSPFVYANQSPIQMIDPTGLTAEFVLEQLKNFGELATEEKIFGNIPLTWRPIGAGQWVVEGRGARKALGVLKWVGTGLELTILSYETYKDFTDKNVSRSTAYKNLAIHGADFGLSVSPVGAHWTAAKIGYGTGNFLFAPGQPLSPVIEGGTVGQTYIPGLGDFTKDVILDPAKTVVNAVGSGASAAGKWIGNKWNSLW